MRKPIGMRIAEKIDKVIPYVLALAGIYLFVHLAVFVVKRIF